MVGRKQKNKYPWIKYHKENIKLHARKIVPKSAKFAHRLISLGKLHTLPGNPIQHSFVSHLIPCTLMGAWIFPADLWIQMILQGPILRVG